MTPRGARSRAPQAGDAGSLCGARLARAAWCVCAVLLLAGVPARSTGADCGALGCPGMALQYGTFIGSTLLDEAEAVACKGDSVYLAGHTQSLVFPAGARRTANAHVVNAFIARIDLAGTGAGFVTVFQGSDLADGEEYIYGLSVDEAGNVYAAGNTNSVDFPVTAGAYQSAYHGNIDAFVVKLAGDGTVLWSTFLGGAEYDSANGLAIDALGNVYVAGGTWSTDFPTTADAFTKTNQGERDAFVAVLDAGGGTLVYGSYIGGSSQEQAEAIALGPGTEIYATGWTRSTDLTSSRAAFPAGVSTPVLSSPFDAFAVRLDRSGTSSDYLITLGGSDEDRGYAITVDASGRAVVSGRSASVDFPVTPGSFGTGYGGGTCSFAPCPDAFVTKLDESGAGLVYSGLLGGGAWDEVNALIAGDDGAVYLAGLTQSPDFPVTSDAPDMSLGGAGDAFLARLAPAGDEVLFASYLGGSEDDVANALDLDAAGRVCVGGMSRSSDFPVTADAFAATLAGDYDAFALILGPAGVADLDADGVPDDTDNCSQAANPDQRDSDGDGFGNLCDADLNGDCTVNFLDLGAMKSVFFSAAPDADLNGDDTVNFLDIGLLKAAFFDSPGPSAFASCP